MKLYHYTSIETLALILKNKTMRFSRLDCVDDPDEYSFSRDGITPAHYCFVSCWTKNSRENLPQWYMYGNSTHGIRIELDSDMFEVSGNIIVPSFFDDEFMRKNRLMVMPLLNDGFLRDIIYKDNAFESVFLNIGSQKAIDFKKIGIYKNTDWAFQQECRFMFYTIPLLPNGKVNIQNALQNNIAPSVTQIDLPIKEEVLQNMSIMLGPQVSEAEKTIVQSLMKVYLDRQNTVNSVYTGKM